MCFVLFLIVKREPLTDPQSSISDEVPPAPESPMTLTELPEPASPATEHSLQTSSEKHRAQEKLVIIFNLCT